MKMDSLESSPSILQTPSTPSTPSRRFGKKDKMRIFSQLSILDASVDGKVSVSLKIEDCPAVDDNSLILLSMPDGPFISKELFKPSFHPFVITVQNGQRIYGGSYIFGFRQQAKRSTEEEKDKNSEPRYVYISRALVAITVKPIVDQLFKILEWCVNEGRCNPKWLRCLAKCRFPAKGKYAEICFPNLKETVYASSSQELLIHQDIRIDIYRPFHPFPLFDYSYRELLTSIFTVDTLLLVYTCALNEVQILISSESYYNLMFVSESIIALLNPFKWQHVYVPILPKKLGFHYLDAPTPFIMGISSKINSSAGEKPIKTSRFACFVDCDKRQVNLNIDQASLFEPPFIDELREEIYELIKSDPRLDSTMIPKSDAVKRVTDLVNKYSFLSEEFSYKDEQNFNQSLRLLFFKTMKKHILNKYQHFIVISHRTEIDAGSKFDTVAYLSDQPHQNRLFLQHFVETQMFASFIDETIKQMKRNQRQYPEGDMKVDFETFLIDDDFDDMDFELYKASVQNTYLAPPLLIRLADLDEIPRSKIPMFSPARRRPNQKGVSNNVVVHQRVDESPGRVVSTALTAQTNWKIVEALLREIRNKTKKILLVKMGIDEVGAQADCQPLHSEENTLIAGLCDLIERIWSHARADDSDNHDWESSKCPFWSHLVAFHERQKDGCMNASNTSLNSRLMHSRRSESVLSIESGNSNDEYENLTWTSLKKHFNSFSQLSLNDGRGNPYGFSTRPKVLSSFTKAVPTTLVYDFENIRNMTEIKTDIGKSRAFIRLSLERKLLSKHLRTLLYNQELLQSLYKRYAFLRCDDERDQFLTHLLTLNAVDLSCFTNTFTTSLISYTLVISSTVSFNGCISIYGSYNSTAEPIHIGTNQHRFTHKNFGFINGIFLRIPSNGPKIFIEQCFIRDDVTSNLFKFDCNASFGLNMDDSSLERFLVGNVVSGTLSENLMKRSTTRSSSITRSMNKRNDKATSPGDEKYSAEDLQTMLGECSNQILKTYFSDNDSNQTSTSVFSVATPTKGRASSSSTAQKQKLKSRQQTPNSMLALFFGEGKLLWILTQIFYYGFKNRRTFRRQTWMWDYVTLLERDLMAYDFLSPNERVYAREYVSLVQNINSKCQLYGKEMKFQIFLLISIRERLLSPHFLKLLSKPNWSATRYDPESFLRNGMHFTFLSEILQTFNELEFKFEPYLTKNL